MLKTTVNTRVDAFGSCVLTDIRLQWWNGDQGYAVLAGVTTNVCPHTVCLHLCFLSV